MNMRPTCLRALAVVVSIAVVAGMTGCATRPTGQEAPRTSVTPFSTAKAEGPLPVGWGLKQLSRFKRDTVYRLVADPTGVTVIEARAEQSASGVGKRLNVDPAAMPWIQWRWNVPALIASADNARRHAEDSPVRVIVTFDGDANKLDIEDRAVSARVKALTGEALPYATLMYIWENKVPVDEIIESVHTTRVKMMVVESGAARIGRWLDYERNIARDFERAFGEKPGRILSLGIMTDTDNTGEVAVAYYGDIHFSPKSLKKDAK
ncbi:MAG: DUF3047 domain-containing protein [Rhodocyclaceae bacterium]|nr:DUF3047 domain-containing protein [Rhodocyclaceae bacterium]MCA3082342.1 DUF3047 domain-containing protein [Rhodocyclaceae bacterium]MCE2722212.1 DUF3047 domain-containing protein [Betaproteobacteria bacterium]